MSRVKDLTGMRFGRLTVEKYAGLNSHNKSLFECKCDCGKNIICVGASLTSGLTTSCGCLQKEKVKITGENSKKKNKYDLSKEYGIGWTSNTNHEFYFDLEDYDKIKNYCWYESQNGYIESRKKEGENYRSVSLHRIVLNEPKCLEVDHIRHDKSDCRKQYLRIVTGSQNSKNKGIRKDNKSGVAGVRYDVETKKWIATIRENNNIHYLGSFSNKEDAVIKRKIAEEKYFGEFSYENSMKVK